MRTGALVPCADTCAPGGCRDHGHRPRGSLGQTRTPPCGDRPSAQTSVVQGRGEQLPYPDGRFDLVTCQTVLIHVADVPTVLREMCRVARPGGTVLVAEPNNFAGQLVPTSVSAKRDPKALASSVHFYATCEAGKAKLGEGDNSVGDLLPGYFAEVGLTVSACYLSDKTSPLWPPYSSPEQAALVQAFSTAAADQRCPWSAEETRRYFVARGGDPTTFSKAWSTRLREMQADLADIQSGTLSTGGGLLMYLVAGKNKGPIPRGPEELELGYEEPDPL